MKTAMESGTKQGFLLQIITPERLLYEGLVNSVILNTVDGQMGILKGRAPACVLLKPAGRIRFHPVSEDGASEKGVPGSRMPQNGAPKNEVAESGVFRNGAPGNGASESGVFRNGAPGRAAADLPQDDDGFINAGLSGGFACINKECIVYADDAWWIEGDETDTGGHRETAREPAPVPLLKLTPNTPPKE